MNPDTIRQVVKGVSAEQRAGYLIVRAQARRELTIKLNNGRIEIFQRLKKRHGGSSLHQ